MKTAFTLLFSLALAAAATAQTTTDVTFAVDMTGARNFRPGVDTLRVAGKFQTPVTSEWTPRARANDNILTDPDGNGVYSVTYKVVPGTYEYKFVINNWNGAGGFNEASGATPVIGSNTACFPANDNRSITVNQTAMMTPIYLYNTCTVSSKLVGINDFAQLEGVQLSPNPVVDQASLTLPAGGTYEIRVMGADGRIVADVKGFQGSAYDLQRDNLASGLYLVEVIEAARGERAVVRFAVQ